MRINERFVTAFAVAMACLLMPQLAYAATHGASLLSAVPLWSLAFLEDTLVLAGMGVLGAAFSLIGVPFSGPRDVILRLLVGGGFAAMAAGFAILALKLDEGHPSVRIFIGGVAGFYSLPAIAWARAGGFKVVIAILTGGFAALQQNQQPPQPPPPPLPPPQPPTPPANNSPPIVEPAQPPVLSGTQGGSK